MSIRSRYISWAWRPGGRRARKWQAARVWAEAMNEKINQLPQHQQDQLDARLHERLFGR